MKTLSKVLISVVALLVAILVSSAAVELSFGEARTGFASVMALVLLYPMLHLIWRKGGSSRTKMSRQQMIEGLREMIDDPDTLPDKREWALGRLEILEKRGK